MRKEYALRYLQMGVSGNNNSGIAFGKLKYRLLKESNPFYKITYFILNVHFDIQGDLVVSGPCGMQSMCWLTYSFKEYILNIGMYIFCVRVKLKFTSFYLINQVEISGKLIHHSLAKTKNISYNYFELKRLFFI